MTYSCKQFSLICTIVICFGCSQVPHFENFDSALWKSDKGGCSGSRSAMAQSLTEIKEALKGLSQKEIVNILGQPDQRELYERHQIYYTYFMNAGKNCNKPAQKPEVLTIRFSALNKASELTISTSY